ncbi:branched-chain amino acid ABC transporter permease [Caldinitratiruptor microaerophilus]|uniref:Branched-chain amino acid ABC transporter permease n=1 Tax=Caldinitratiruptor microaerophilus TaxID=671077 RepID=A0AA35CMK5_9FIRM|nr:branched-chain amino acid ABC transporter permease [Caldinitratiruptor microaerophilus]
MNRRLTLAPGAAPWQEWSWSTWGLIFLVLLVLPVFVNSSYVLHTAVSFFIWAVVNEMWNLVMGYGGIPSFGQLALFGVGGYASGMLAVYAHVNPWITMPVGALVAGVVGLLLGLPVLRLRGVYVVLLTLAFHQIIYLTIVTDDTKITGGGFGLRVPSLGLDRLGPEHELMAYYWVALVLFAVSTYSIFRVVNSRVGLAFKALRDSEAYAVSRGISPFRYKLLLFFISAVFTGLAGAFYGHYLKVMAPGMLSFAQMTNLLAMLVIGGWGSFGGPIVGTLLLTVLNELLKDVDRFRLLLLGAAMVLFVVTMPRGVVPTMTDVFKLWFGPKEETKEEVSGSDSEEAGA